jgi:hypothetical protein
MIKTANAGNTAKGGILGRRKREQPEPATYVTTWWKGEDGRSWCAVRSLRPESPGLRLP